LNRKLIPSIAFRNDRGPLTKPGSLRRKNPIELSALHLSARVDDAVHGAVGGQRLASRRRVVDRIGRPGVLLLELLHLDALALVPVVEIVVAEDLGERVDVVRRRRRGTPRVVAAVSELHHQVDAGERRAACVEARPMELLLHQDLWDVVANLWAEDADRISGGRLPRADHLPVRSKRVCVERPLQLCAERVRGAGARAFE
jgi:hypothetical protein